MKTILNAGLLALLVTLLGAPTAPAQSAAEAPTTPRAQTPASSITASDSSRADAFYYFTTGHLQERQYEMTSSAEFATQSIESYKKALELDPGSAVIMERLAEIYAKSQHIRDAVIQAQNALKIDPDNVDAHRLLARIYVRTLGDMSAGEVQQENLAKAVEQFQAILKIEPNDTYSLLWLARLYRFQNQHAEAEKVLRRILAHDSDNGPALEQLSQLLIDQGRSQEAIELLTHAAGDTASPDVLRLAGRRVFASEGLPQGGTGLPPGHCRGPGGSRPSPRIGAGAAFRR